MINKKKEQKESFEALKRMESGAIRQLASKISYGAKQAANNARLTPQDAEELINDALVITLKNIQLGKFRFMDISPTAYALGVIRKLVANKIKTRKPITASLTGAEHLPDFSPDEYFKKKEKEQLISKLLSKLGDVCQKIIKLKYFEEMKDAEIVQQQLVDFSSINSLKSKRSQCLKKLIEMTKDMDKEEVFG